MEILNYRKKYLQIYIWQSLSVLLGFFSLFVVIPYLSSNKALYGIFSICTSLTIFFSYADLGFISAGIKYAAEYFIRGEKDNEIKMIGFVGFMMVVAFSVISLIIMICAIFPNMLIPELIEGSQYFNIARNLLLILAVSCPIIIGQRILTMIFTIRVEDFKFQRISIVGSLIKIVSVFYFFRSGCYELIEYYLFFQLINLLVVIVAFIYVRRYGYKITLLLSSFRFSKTIFDKVKKLSGTSLVMVIAMILYYELDQIVIANFISIDAVANYAIALSVMAFVRSLMGILYAPYMSRYNHYSGMGDIRGLQNFLRKIIIDLSPIVCCPILILACLATPFVNSWVGENYLSSSYLISIMVLSFIPNFITTPISSYFVAREENARLVKFSVFSVIIYWMGIFLSVHLLGSYSFAVFKFVAPVLLVFGYWKVTKQDFKEHDIPFISTGELAKVLFIPVIVALCTSWVARCLMLYEHSDIALFYNLLIMALCLILSMISILFSNKQIRVTVGNLFVDQTK